MAVDVGRIVSAAVEATFDELKSSKRKRRLTAGRAVVLGAAAVTAGRLAARPGGRFVRTKLREWAEEEERPRAEEAAEPEEEPRAEEEAAEPEAEEAEEVEEAEEPVTEEEEAGERPPTPRPPIFDRSSRRSKVRPGARPPGRPGGDRKTPAKRKPPKSPASRG